MWSRCSNIYISITQRGMQILLPISIDGVRRKLWVNFSHASQKERTESTTDQRNDWDDIYLNVSIMSVRKIPLLSGAYANVSTNWEHLWNPLHSTYWLLHWIALSTLIEIISPHVKEGRGIWDRNFNANVWIENDLLLDATIVSSVWCGIKWSIVQDDIPPKMGHFDEIIDINDISIIIKYTF